MQHGRVIHLLLAITVLIQALSVAPAAMAFVGTTEHSKPSHSQQVASEPPATLAVAEHTGCHGKQQATAPKDCCGIMDDANCLLACASAIGALTSAVFTSGQLPQRASYVSAIESTPHFQPSPLFHPPRPS